MKELFPQKVKIIFGHGLNRHGFTVQVRESRPSYCADIIALYIFLL
jgi:hypothetical protein